MGKAASEIRNKLGESLNAVQKFDTPLERATTPSLEALQAYSLGRRAMAGSEWAAAVPFFQRAIRLDPNFAMAYARLGTSFSNLGETKLGAENSRKAYELREGVSDGEKFYIEAHYYQFGTGNLEKCTPEPSTLGGNLSSRLAATAAPMFASMGRSGNMTNLWQKPVRPFASTRGAL